MQFTTRQLMREVDRELDRRLRAYPSLIERGKLTQAEADYRIRAIVEVRDRLSLLDDIAAAVRTLEDRTAQPGDLLAAVA